MSTHHTDGEKEQEKPVSALPSIHTQETLPDQAGFPSPPSPPPLRPKKRHWFVGSIVSAIIVLLLAVSVGALVLAQLERQPVPPTPTPRPTATPMPLPTGQWMQVLKDYRVTSLAAAPSHPNVLYACAVPPGLPATMAGVQTILRSEDFGTTWQDIGSRAQMSRGCQLTINPTDSYEIYVATSSNPPTDPAVPSYVLEHTSNGGDSWETIHPTVHGPGLNVAPAWQGTQFSFAGNHLYSLQSLPIPPMPTPQGHQGPLPTSWTRLVMSTDGGHTWNVLDNQFSRTWQSAWTYAVNPANPSIFYELVSLPAAVPGAGVPNAELYKSVDGGKTWQPVLKQIGVTPSPIEILTGSEKPNVVYLTHTWCPADRKSVV